MLKNQLFKNWLLFRLIFLLSDIFEKKKKTNTLETIYEDTQIFNSLSFKAQVSIPRHS